MRSWQRCCSSSRGLQRHHIMELAVGVPNYCDLGIRTAGLHLQVWQGVEYSLSGVVTGHVLCRVTKQQVYREASN